MRFCRLLVYDLRQGLSWKKYLLSILLFSARLFTLHRSIRFYYGASLISVHATAGDYILGMFRGMAILQNVSIAEKVIIPIEWLVVCGVSLYNTAVYPAQGISIQGQQIFLRTSRSKWWLSKCVWCTASCLLYFVCEVIVIIGAALFGLSELSWGNTPEVTTFLFSEVLWEQTIVLAPLTVFLYGILLPFVTLLALCMLQTCLNLILRPAISFLITFILIVIAAYFPSEYLVGNGAMIMRSQLFDLAGLNIYQEMASALLLFLLSIGCGWMIIRKMDLISLEK